MTKEELVEISMIAYVKAMGWPVECVNDQMRKAMEKAIAAFKNRIFEKEDKLIFLHILSLLHGLGEDCTEVTVRFPDGYEIVFEQYPKLAMKIAFEVIRNYANVTKAEWDLIKERTFHELTEGSIQ